MHLTKPPKNLTEAVSNGIQESRDREFRGNMPHTHEFVTKWITAHVKEFITQKLTPVMLRAKDCPALQLILRTFADELGLGIRIESEEVKHE